jgi:NitT/TauT family transport system ATP-binding protein
LSTLPPQAVLDCRGVWKSYVTHTGRLSVLEDVNCRVCREEFICIVGPSGCGKTTFLKIVAGLIRPTSGEVRFCEPAANGKRPTALVFQDHGLFPWLTVIENVAFGLEMMGVGKRERSERARDFIEKIGLGSFARNYPYELSAGMRQRVGIARSFLTDPKILLMDEPLSSLDAQTRRLMQEELLRLWQNDRKSVIYITHDIEEAVMLGDRVIVMTGRPATIRKEISIPLDRPRDLSVCKRPDMTAVIHHIWEILKDEVQKTLWFPA